MFIIKIYPESTNPKVLEVAVKANPGSRLVRHENTCTYAIIFSDMTLSQPIDRFISVKHPLKETFYVDEDFHVEYKSAFDRKEGGVLHILKESEFETFKDIHDDEDYTVFLDRTGEESALRWVILFEDMSKQSDHTNVV